MAAATILNILPALILFQSHDHFLVLAVYTSTKYHKYISIYLVTVSCRTIQNGRRLPSLIYICNAKQLPGTKSPAKLKRFSNFVSIMMSSVPNQAKANAKHYAELLMQECKSFLVLESWTFFGLRYRDKVHDDIAISSLLPLASMMQVACARTLQPARNTGLAGMTIQDAQAQWHTQINQQCMQRV